MKHTSSRPVLQAVGKKPIRVLLTMCATCLLPSFVARGQNLYVANTNTNTVTVFNAATGSTLPAYTFNNLDGPFGLALSGNNLYVANYNSGTVNEVNATTGAAIPGFISLTGLGRPTGLAFSSSTLYVASYGTNVVRAFNAVTGATIPGFTSPAGLSRPYGLAISGNTLYVASSVPNTVGAYDALTGAALPGFTPPTGLNLPVGLTLGGGILYVADASNATVKAFNAATGARIPGFAPTGLSTPIGLALSGNILYVSDNGVDGIYELDATTGARIRYFSDIGFSEPSFLAVSPVPEPATWTMLLLLGGTLAASRLHSRSRCRLWLLVDLVASALPEKRLLPTRVLRQVVLAATAAVLLVQSGCKPAAAPSSSDNKVSGPTSRQPTADEFRAFFQSLLPAAVKLSDLKTDPPTHMPNTAPADNTWLINAKIVLTPTEDLYSLPPAADTESIKDLVEELNTLIHWRNAYARSLYSRIYGAFDIQAPADLPQLLIVRQIKNKPLPAIYGKVAAEWQVDHWQFTNVDIELPVTGRLRSSFTAGPTMVKGSPEAETILATERKIIAAAKQRQAEIESSYSKDLFAATKPGTIYRGQISQTRGVLPCEVRFLDTPGADPKMATFEIALPKEPTYQLTYTARLAPKLPLDIPDGTLVYEAAHPASRSGEAEPPVANVTVSFTRGTGKKSLFGTLPSVLRNGTDYIGDKPFLLLDGHLKGVVASFNGDFSMSAELVRPGQ